MPKHSGLYKFINSTLLDPFVLKFVSDSTHLNEFIANDYKFSYFRGQMGIHKYTDYFQTGLGLKTEATGCTPAFDAFGDPIPCDVVSFPGSGPSSGGGTTSSSGGTTCSWYVTYLPCGCGGHADGHAPSGVSCCQGSPSILTKVCPPSLKMPTANKATSTVNPCPDCPTGNDGGVGVSLSDTALNNIINTLQLGANDKVRLTWLKVVATPAEILAINQFIVDNHNTVEVVAFINEAITALMNNKFVDFDEAYITYPTPDDNYVYQGPKQYIPNPLILSNGDSVSLQFGTTEDNINANQQVATDLIDGLKFAIEQANNNLPASEKITSIYIMATTNGHGTTGKSNHLNATAIVISRINNIKMAFSGLTYQIIELQKAFDNFQYIRENFGPFFKHKYMVELDTWDYNKIGIGAHLDHIHISVRR